MYGIYVHIPFCSSRCIYCGFYSTTGKSSYQDDYIRSVIKEAGLRKDYIYNNERARTLYIGGGTPSTLSITQLKELLDGLCQEIPTLSIEGLEEFTIECNPNEVTEEYAAGLASFGVNRVSMGVQSFDDERLKFLKRRHKAAEIPIAIKNLKDAGIDNISIDLIFGFPDETLDDWSEDIRKALSMDVKHISSYSLTYEEGTPLYSMLKRGEISETDENISRQMYYMLIDKLENAGYDHYEISNFARPGFRSIHNSSYWNDTPYLGLGAAAHSYNGKNRQWNVCNIKEYINSLKNGTLPFGEEEIDSATHYNDMITTALRAKDGIIINKVPEPYRSYMTEIAKKGVSNGFLSYKDGRLALSREGLFISDDIMSDLIWV